MITIGVLARPNLVQAGGTIRDLVIWLREHGATPMLDEATAALGGPEAASASRVLSGREVADGADALVVLGGDGTLLAASRLLERAVPVLGVNFGSLGFLTEIALPELLPTLQGVLEKRYEYEERRLLHAVVARRGHPDATGDVLNDVVITKAGPSRIIELDVTVDGLFVSSFHADGLTFAYSANAEQDGLPLVVVVGSQSRKGSQSQLGKQVLRARQDGILVFPAIALDRSFQDG